MLTVKPVAKPSDSPLPPSSNSCFPSIITLHDCEDRKQEGGLVEGGGDLYGAEYCASNA